VKLARVYGSSLPLQLTMEERIVASVSRARVPGSGAAYGLPAGHVGLETLLGVDEDIQFGDYLNLPQNQPIVKQPQRDLLQTGNATNKPR
jgi:hypothetical protein